MDEARTGDEENIPEDSTPESEEIDSETSEASDVESEGEEPGVAEMKAGSVDSTPPEEHDATGTPPGFDAAEISQLKLCRIGFTIIYIAVGIYAVAFIALGALLYLGVSMAVDPTSMSGTGAAMGSVFLIGLAVIIAAWMTVVGTGFFMATPKRSGGRSLLQVSFLLILGGILANLFVKETSLMVTPGTLAVFGPKMAAYIVSQAAAAIVFYLGVTRLMEFVGSTRNAARAKSLVIWSQIFYVDVLAVFYVQSIVPTVENPGIKVVWAALGFGVCIVGLVVLFKYIRLLSDGGKAIKEAIS
tara:strand:+ start:61 stop:963 length:903 start_codon:yes stop_codon:yes gene_type:complete